MKIQFNDLNRIHEPIRKELDLVWKNIVNNNNFILGNTLEDFEKNFAIYNGLNDQNNCAGVSNGMDALELSLRALNIGDGDEVITVSNTFNATASAIKIVGAKPIFVDINPKTLLIDINKIEKKITSKTKAILPVHLYGQMVDMKKLSDLCSSYDLNIIEDACQAHGSKQNGHDPGKYSDAAAFSFYPGKNLGAFGDGGAVISKDSDIINKIKKFRNYGQTKKYHHDTQGFNKRLDTLQAAILNIKLKHLDSWNESRIRTAKKLIKGLHSNIELVQTLEGNKHNYHLFIIKTTNRNELRDFLESKQIESGIHYPIPIHMQESFKYLSVNNDLQETENQSKNILSLPIFPFMLDEEIEYVLEYVNHFFDLIATDK